MKQKAFRYLGLAGLAVVILASLVAALLSAFWIGRLEGALNPVRSADKLMCVGRDVDIRHAPTGYVIGHAPAGSKLWFVKLDLPFAYVAYYDGSAWLEGSVTASVLELCK